METIYLDYAATTPIRNEVIDAMLPYFKTTYGNPSSLHHVGREAQRILEGTRERIASHLRVSPHEIIFTSGGTEANNLALFGIAHAHKGNGKHILISQIEHASILSAGKILKEEGFDVEYVPVDAYGRVSPTDILSRIRKDTILISVMCANNEIGTVEPITEIGALLKEEYAETERPFFHTDACQAVGQLTVTPSLLNVDLMTINSGKIYGPKGVGLLYTRTGVTLSPHIVGGHQEMGRRGGTENVPLIIGFETALRYAIEELDTTRTHLLELQTFALELIKKRLPKATLNGHPTERLLNNIHLSFPCIEGESLLLLLDTQGVCVSTGSACASHALLPSHVLRAIGQKNELIHGSIRISLGKYTTKPELLTTIEILESAVNRLTKMSPLTP
jgi:cysteine desulfurase